MKRINSHGFAISTMLYGLLIISSLIIFMLLEMMVFNKKSSSDFVNQVEKELNKFSDRVITNAPVIVPEKASAYTYNSSTCTTGNEAGCLATNCYNNNAANSCPAGTIINYKVKEGEIVTFHVVTDLGTKLVLQSQRNIVYNTPWNSAAADNSRGPMTILPILENATSSWVNVNELVYQPGNTKFEWVGSSFVTPTHSMGCSLQNVGGSCAKDSYVLAARRARARLLTFWEAINLGCYTFPGEKRCPVWLYNYLYHSVDNGGTANENSYQFDIDNKGYWLLSVSSTRDANAWTITTDSDNNDGLRSDITTSREYGARAVVEVNKSSVKSQIEG